MTEPARYALFNSICRHNVSNLLNQFAKKLKSISGKCMDVGCGPGDITNDILLPFLKPSATIIGTDIMEKMIEYANKSYGHKERLKFEVLDIQTKKLPEKYILEFDHIFSFHTLQWCHDLPQTFENIYHMLRPDKTMLILSIAKHGTLFETVEAMAQDVRYAKYMKDKKKYIGSLHYLTRPHEEVKKILESIGFQVYHCSHQEFSSFLSSKEFISMVTSQQTFAFLDNMSHNLREEFQNELTHMFEERRIKEYKDKQNNDKLYDNKKEIDIPYYYTVLVVFAQKSVL